MAEAQDRLDTRALEIATQALARIAAHEKVCDERWREQRVWVRELADRIEKLTETTQSGFERLREAVASKITEVHSRVDVIEKEARQDAKTEARSANERLWAIVLKVVLGIVGLGFAGVAGSQIGGGP